MKSSPTRERQIARLEEAVELLGVATRALGEQSFLSRHGGWSPRDILAHLIGWNPAIVDGCRQLLRGELPFYDVDPGDDYCKVNAQFVRQHASTSREGLLADLGSSAARLGRFLEALDPVDWDRDSGVSHEGEQLTIRDTVDELIDDYRHHSEQIRGWEPRG